MEKRRIITLIMAAVWVITSSPYIAATLLSAHGHHTVTTEVANGTVALVFHHEDEDSHHHHADHHQDKDDHSTNGDDHRLSTLSADVVTFPSLNTQVITKYIPVISFSGIFSTLTQVLTLDASLNFLNSESLRIPTSFSSLRTIVLLI
jgi:hypothetical protein